MESMEDLKETLTKIGLTKGESQVYNALIELGQTTAGKIIKKANIASSKVYDVLYKLQIKGLVGYVIKENIKYYDATPPERLIDFLEEEKENLSEAQSKIKKIIPSIKAKQKKQEEKNNVTVYTGLQGPKIVLKETIEAGRKGEKLMGFGTDEDPYKDHLPAQIKEHFKDQKKYKIKWYLLFTKGEWSSPSPLSEIRYLPKGQNIPVRTMIYGNKVAIVDFNKPFTTIIIEKKEIAEAYKQQFETLWKIAKKD
jgi:predicted DNA-binding transcriptional regulator